MATRTSNTNARGSQFEAQRTVDVWNKGRIVQGYDPSDYRQDAYGTWIAWSEYGATSKYGWEIDHIVPVARGGGDDLRNLQPLHWSNNRAKGDT